MARLHLDIVTAERQVYSDDADMVTAPGADGEMGILPQHAPLLSLLKPGQLRVKKGNTEELLAVAGGFLEVSHNHVIILADAAERADEIDESRAESARKQAEQFLAKKTGVSDKELAEAELALRRALTRLKVAELRRKNRNVVS